jgi:hypothetical protein
MENLMSKSSKEIKDVILDYWLSLKYTLGFALVI